MTEAAKAAEIEAASEATTEAAKATEIKAATAISEAAKAAESDILDFKKREAPQETNTRKKEKAQQA